MQFKLTIDLDADEAAEMGRDALGHYLREVAGKVESGRDGGFVVSLDGVLVGEFNITDD
jgi:hypothetical protein